MKRYYSNLIIIFIVSIFGITQGCQTFISAKTVSELETLDQVVPEPVNCGGISCFLYLSSSSCLGASGPIGSMGPLESLGPVGQNDWNPSQWISGFGDWSDFSKNITGMGGPLSADGPLGYNGPLSLAWYQGVLPTINDFALHLQGHGLWSVLGPLGPLGPVGLLGPLGPIGAHGFLRNSDGDFVNPENKTMRTISAPYDDSTNRTWELYEEYTKTRAQQLGKQGQQDSSFMVEANLSGYDDEDVYIFQTYSGPQYVTIVVSPGYLLDNFNITLYESTSTIALHSSDLITYVNWIQMYVETPSTFRVSIKLVYAGQILDHPYRLLVTGGSTYIPQSKFSGPYIESCT